MKKSQMWSRRSLSDAKKDDMTIDSTLWFIEKKVMDGRCPTKKI